MAITPSNDGYIYVGASGQPEEAIGIMDGGAPEESVLVTLVSPDGTGDVAMYETAGGDLVAATGVFLVNAPYRNTAGAWTNPLLVSIVSGPAFEDGNGAFRNVLPVVLLAD